MEISQKHESEDGVGESEAENQSPESGSRAHEDGEGYPYRPGVDYVAAVPRSPTSLFVYWELDGERSRFYRDDYTDSLKWRLSLKNVKDSGEVNWRSEVSIDPTAGNHYLSVQPGNRYRVELGVRVGEVFHSICHSRERIMPRSSPPDNGRKGSDGGAGSEAEQFLGDGADKDVPHGLIWRDDIMDGLTSS